MPLAAVKRDNNLALVATSMKSTPIVLLTKGNDLDARRLHSMTMQSVPFAMNCMLNGPVMFSLLATALVASCNASARSSNSSRQGHAKQKNAKPNSAEAIKSYTGDETQN